MGILQQLAQQRYERQKKQEMKRISRLAKNHIVDNLPDGSICHCLHLYYSVHRHGYEIPNDAMKFRRDIYAFKDGTHLEWFTFAREIVAVLQELYGENTKEMVLCTAQARTQIRAEKRFAEFCEYISEKTSAINGFESLLSGKSSGRLL